MKKLKVVLPCDLFNERIALIEKQVILIMKAKDLGPKTYRANCGNCSRSFVVCDPYETIVCPSCLKELRAQEVTML